MRLLTSILVLFASAVFAAPVITSLTPNTGPTAGGTTLLLQGTGFEGTMTVSVGGRPCSSVVVASQSSLTCTLPSGQGTLLDVVATGAVNGASNAAKFSYQAPVISSVRVEATGVAGLGPTSGTAIVIDGQNFGFTPSVLIGTTVCPALRSTPHTSYTCLAPPGQGTAVVTITVAGQSGTSSASYAPPSITAATPLGGPTIGGGLLTLTGTSFGLSGGVVTINGVACPVQSQTHTEVRCNIPAGSGKDLPVVFTVGGQSSAGGVTPLYSYNPPVITSITGERPTSGGTLITINGANFGFGVGVTIGGRACPLTSQRDDRLSCTLPVAPVIRDMTLVVEVNGQSVSAPFAYDAPQLLSVSPPTARTAGGTTLTLVGENFGEPNGASVTVDGKACPTLTQQHSQITCALPAGIGRNLFTVVSFNGQVAALNTFSYLAPVVTTVGTVTAGGGPLTITGDNFGATLGATVRIGGANCPVTAATHTSLTCTAPSGNGGGYSLVVTVGGQVSNAATFSFAPPVITSISGRTPTEGGTTLSISGSSFSTIGSTVRVGGALCPVTFQSDSLVRCTLPPGQGSNVQVEMVVGTIRASSSLNYEAPAIVSAAPLPGARDGGEALTLSGVNFGTTATVLIGSTACPVTAQGHAQLTCTTPAGRGPAPIIVTVAGQQSNPFEWRYANSPPAVPATTPLLFSEDVPAAVVLPVSDADQDTVTWSLVPLSGPSPDAGVVTFDGGSGRWTPTPNFNGSTSFRAVASDGEASSAELLVTVNVRPANDLPVALPVSASTDEELAVTIAPQGSDVDGDALTTLVSRAPDAGIASVVVDAQQRLVVTPALDYRGTFAFGYQLRDPFAGTSDEAEVTVQVANLNDAPVAAGTTVSVVEDTPHALSLVATDVDGDALTLSLVDAPASGTVAFAGAVATFTPAQDMTGAVSFTFRAYDGVLYSSPATVTVNVTRVNDAPVATNVAASTTAPNPVTFTLVAGDVDGDSLTFQVTRAPALGEGTVSIAGSQATFTPAAGFSGTSTFDFEARDSTSAAGTATATVTVRAQDMAPTFRAPTPTGDVSGRVGEVLSFTIAADDDFGPLTYDVRGRPMASTFDTGSGVLSWTPTAMDVGSVPVVLVVSDGMHEVTRSLSLVVGDVVMDGGAGGGGGSGGGAGAGGGSATGGGDGTRGGAGEPSSCGCAALDVPVLWLGLLAVVSRRRGARK